VQDALNFKEPQVDIDPLDKLPVAMMISGLSRSSLYKLIAKNQFPRPVKHGKASVWLRSEVVAWVAARLLERDAAIPKSMNAQKVLQRIAQPQRQNQIHKLEELNEH
jgi:prophage regulatory protein